MKPAFATVVGLLFGLMLLVQQLGAEQIPDEETRFRATVLAIVPLAEFSGEVTPVAVDPQFALTMRFETTVPAVPEFAAGRSVTFAIHSPSLLFEGEPKPGETYDFVLHRKAQSGKVRFVGLQRAYPAVMDRDYPRWAKAQKYAAIGFKPIDCFGGQVRIRGKRLRGQPFSVYSTDANMKCCGTLIMTALTDKHGHFLVEPMKEGEYFAKFNFNEVQYVTNFAVIQNYTRCEATHVEINFSDVSKTELQTYVDIDDSGEPCEPTQPRCFRK